MTANNAIPPTPTAVLRCAKCGASLPDEAEFCLKCGKPVSSPTKSMPPIVEVLPPALPPAPHPKRRIFLWVMVVVLVGLLLWAATSSNPFAQGLQELVGFKQDETIIDSSFTVGPHSFRYYKFALPEGSLNVSVVGQFSSASNASSTNRKDTSKDRNKDKENDNDIEVSILTEAAFTIWQNGYATSSVYESGKTSQGEMQTEVPAGAGIYYLVFSNKFAPKTAKSVHAQVFLRYKSWLPDGIRRMKARITNWIGL
jgi:zinc-ribbon domain